MSKSVKKVYHRPAGSNRHAKVKLCTVKKVSIANLKPNTVFNKLNIS